MSKNKKHPEPPERVRVDGGAIFERMLCEILDTDEKGRPTLLAIIDSAYAIELPPPSSDNFRFIYLEESPEN